MALDAQRLVSLVALLLVLFRSEKNQALTLEKNLEKLLTFAVARWQDSNSATRFKARC